MVRGWVGGLAVGEGILLVRAWWGDGRRGRGRGGGGGAGGETGAKGGETGRRKGRGGAKGVEGGRKEEVLRTLVVARMGSRSGLVRVGRRRDLNRTVDRYVRS